MLACHKAEHLTPLCASTCTFSADRPSAFTPTLRHTSQVSHVMLDPLCRDQLASLPLHRLRAAIVLADEGWCSSDNTYQRHANSPTVSDATDQPGVLTQDALSVMVQVRRHCIQSYLAQTDLTLWLFKRTTSIWFDQTPHSLYESDTNGDSKSQAIQLRGSRTFCFLGI